MNAETIQAGREMDALVAERVMGWKRVPMPKYVAPTEPPTTIFTILVDVGGPDYFEAPEGNRFMQMSYPLTPQQIVPHFSTDIAAAWQVVERMRQYIGAEDNDRWGDFTEALNEAYDYRISALMGELTPLAICRAALEAFNV